MKRVVAAVMLLSLIFGVPTYGHAAVLNVQFGPAGIDYTGTAAAPDTGTIWNYVTAPLAGGSSQSLNASGFDYSDGSPASGITISSSVPVWSWNEGSYSGLTDNRVFNTIPSPFTGQTYPFSLTISGLDNSLTYNLYCYASNPSYATTYTVGSTSGSAYGQLGDSNPFQATTDYALLSDLTPIAGAITIELSHFDLGTAAVIGGLQLETVPEPSTLIVWSLLGTIGLGLGWWRKRKAA